MLYPLYEPKIKSKEPGSGGGSSAKKLINTSLSPVVEIQSIETGSDPVLVTFRYLEIGLLSATF
jgi:hypothetical protein